MQTRVIERAHLDRYRVIYIFMLKRYIFFWKLVIDEIENL